MRLFDILAILVSLSAVFSYLNHRFLKLPTAIGLMLIALLMSLGLIATGPLGLGIEEEVEVMLRSVDNYQVEVLITLAVVTGGYAIAEKLHISAPIAIVVAGLLIGNHGRVTAMSERTRENLDTFWELVDEVLNAALFVLIGLEVLILSFRGEFLIAGLLAIPTVLLARLISVGFPIGLMRRFRTFTPGVVSILTWGGLRGGISVALALSLPAGEVRDILVAVTYVVVVFSILVQGLTIEGLVRRKTGSVVTTTQELRHAGREGQGG